MYIRNTDDEQTDITTVAEEIKDRLATYGPTSGPLVEVNMAFDCVTIGVLTHGVTARALVEKVLEGCTPGGPYDDV